MAHERPVRPECPACGDWMRRGARQVRGSAVVRWWTCPACGVHVTRPDDGVWPGEVPAAGPAVACPRCGSRRSHVRQTRRVLAGVVKRRRECLSCGVRFSTSETIEASR